VVPALAQIRPTVWLAVPRIWEKLMASLTAGGVVDPHGLSREERAALRAKLGLDRASALVSGAAPITIEVLEYFAALDMEILEGWAMSETGCIGTINRPGHVRVGTVGTAAPGVDLRLADDGELLVRGKNVMVGYRGDPAQTVDAFWGDGWLRTGDIAEIDADGYVTIVDRKKELIINAAGKNMSPANIEQVVKSSHPLIGQVAVIGDRRPYNVALIVLDPDAADGRSATDADVQEAVTKAVDEANARLARVEQIKRFTLLPDDWLPGGDELTPTMKLKRKPIAEKYAREIEAMYATAKPGTSEPVR
jgi:long-subunit acyl-CoA synthetase (AMP-forming)